MENNIKNQIHTYNKAKKIKIKMKKKKPCKDGF